MAFNGSTECPDGCLANVDIENFLCNEKLDQTWLNRLNGYFGSLANAVCCVESQAIAGIRIREWWGGSNFTGAIDQSIFNWTYVRAFTNSQCLITINFDSMIESEVGPPQNDTAMTAVYSLDVGLGLFDCGTNFINSTVTGGTTSDSVSEVTHISTTRRVTAQGNIPINIHAKVQLFQGSNPRGWHRHIRVTVIEVDNKWIS